MHKETGNKVAIKILKNNLSESAIKTILTEINALKAIEKHENIIGLISYNQEEYIKKSGSLIVTYIVLELAAGGELFNLISITGKFDEDLSRFYFKKMV